MTTLNILIRRFKVWTWFFKKNFYYFLSLYGVIFYTGIFILSITMLFMIVINYIFPSYLEHILPNVKGFLLICGLLVLPLSWCSICEQTGSIDEELKNFYFLTFLAIIVFCFSLCLCSSIKFTIIISLIIFLEELILLVLTCASLAEKEFKRNWASSLKKFSEAWISMDFIDITEIHIQDHNTIAPLCFFLAIFIIILLGPLAWILILIAYMKEDSRQFIRKLYYLLCLPVKGPSEYAKRFWEARAAYMEKKVAERIQACEHAAVNAYVTALINASKAGANKTKEVYEGALTMAAYAAEKAGATRKEANNIAEKTHILYQHILIAKAGAMIVGPHDEKIKLQQQRKEQAALEIRRWVEQSLKRNIPYHRYGALGGLFYEVLGSEHKLVKLIENPWFQIIFFVGLLIAALIF